MHFFSSSFSIFNHYFHVQFEVNISGVKICGLCLPKISGSLILLCNYNWTKNFGDKLVMITYIPLGRLLLIKTCCSIVIRKKKFCDVAGGFIASDDESDWKKSVRHSV